MFISGLTEKEKCLLANREREKGNEAFHAGDYEEAVMYYTRQGGFHLTGAELCYLRG